MDFLENPFFILDATPHDNDKRIMDLAVACGLFQDPARCREAKAILMSPLKRIYAEIAWLPAKNSEHAKKICELLGSSQGNLCARDRLVQVQDLLGIDELMPIAKCNVLAAGLRRLPRHSSDAVAAWILEFVHASETIDAENLCEIINSDRKVAGSPTAKLPDMETEIENLRDHYRQVMASAMNQLSAEERAAAMTTVVESATDNERQAPLLINRLVDWYELEAQKSLEEHEAKIGELEGQLRLAADENHPDSVLSSLVKQVTQAVKDWERVAKPVQVSRESRGLSQDESKCVAQRVQNLAMYLFDPHDKLNFCMQLIGTLKGAFNGVNEISNRLSVIMIGLNTTAQERERGARRIIECQVKKLRAPTDKQQHDSDLSQMVTQLIEAVKYWKTSAQLCEKYYADFYIEVVANLVHELAHDLRNEHEKFDDSHQLFEMLRKEFAQVAEIPAREIPHLDELDAAKSVQGDITQQVSKLQTAADMKQPDSILSEIVNQLIQTVKEWKTCAQPIEAYYADYYHVVNLVMELALHLRKERGRLVLSGRLLKTLREEFAELGEIESLIDDHLKALETTENALGEIILKDVKLRAAAREKQPDSVLSEMVDQLIQAVDEWRARTQPIEAYNKDYYQVAYLVLELACHLLEEHRKLDDSRKLFEMLQEEFAELDEIAARVAKYYDALEAREAAENARREIEMQVKRLRGAVYAKHSHPDLSPMVNQLIHAVEGWRDLALPIKTYYGDYCCSVAKLVLKLTICLRKKGKLRSHDQLFKMLQDIFGGIPEIVTLLAEEAKARDEAEKKYARRHDRKRARWETVIIAVIIIGSVVALLLVGLF